MIPASVVTIVVNGAIVSSFAPARIVGGRIFAPLVPVVVQLAARTTFDSALRSIVIERAGLRIDVPIAFVADDAAFIELGPVVRGIGGSADFDSATKTLAIVLPAPPIATPGPSLGATPTGPAYVEPAPSATKPSTPAPRSSDTGMPRPRRTAIPVVPSEPIAPAPSPTNRRR